MRGAWTTTSKNLNRNERDTQPLLTTEVQQNCWIKRYKHNTVFKT